jgi:hypothetical protein
MAQSKLTTEILKLSKSQDWEAAKLEWHLEQVYMAESPETCLCGHFPIIEICTIANARTLHTATVGNCCVTKFIGLPSKRIFDGLKRVRKDVQSALNEDAITYSRSKGWISSWEYGFLVSTMRKRNLSGKQRQFRESINSKILARLKTDAPTRPASRPALPQT